MTKIQSLLSQAAVIRDATSEGENTALRVGSMFVSLIQAIVETLPSEILDATGITYSAGESNFIITFSSIDDNGNEGSRRIIIPATSQDKAGLLTPAKLKEINQAISDISKAVTSALEARNLATEALENIKAVWFDGVVTLQADELLKQSLAIAPTNILWDFTNNCFVGERDGKYYANWVGREGSDFVSVVDNKRYIVIDSRQEYIGFGGLLEMIGTDVVRTESEIKGLQNTTNELELNDVDFNFLSNSDFREFTMVDGMPEFNGWTADVNSAVYDDELRQYVLALESGAYWRQGHDNFRSTPPQMREMGSGNPRPQLSGMCCTFWYKSSISAKVQTNIGIVIVDPTDGEWRQAKIYGQWDGNGFLLGEGLGSDIRICRIALTLDKLGDVEAEFDGKVSTLERKVVDVKEQVASLIKPNVTWITIDQTIADPATMISGDVNGEQIRLIRSNSHRYLIGAQKSTGKTYRACQLSDSNSNMFNQMSDPTIDPSVDLAESGEVFVRIPNFYYKCYELRKDVWRIGFCYGSTIPEENAGWNYYKSKYIGAYKADMDEGGSTIYSRSHKEGRVTALGYTRDQFIEMAQNRVSNMAQYNILSWTDHCVLALLYFGQYGNADSSNVIGRGSWEATPAFMNGETNSRGMNDTAAPEDHGKANNFWGLELLWGSYHEVFSGISYKGNVGNKSIFAVGTGSNQQEVEVPKVVIGRGILKLLFGTSGDLLPTLYGEVHNVGYNDVVSGNLSNDEVSSGSVTYYGDTGVTAMCVGGFALPQGTRITRTLTGVTELANGDEYLAHINS